MLEMFPSYSDSDFAEFKAPLLEQKKTKPVADKKIKQLIDSEDVSLIYKWHSNFVRNLTTAEWLPSPKKLVGNDVISALVQRYPIFSRVMSNAWEALDAEFEGAITPSLMVILAQIKERIDGSGKYLTLQHVNSLTLIHKCKRYWITLEFGLSIPYVY